MAPNQSYKSFECDADDLDGPSCFEYISCSLFKKFSQNFEIEGLKEIENVQDGFKSANGFFYEQEIKYYWSTIYMRIVSTIFASIGFYLIYMPILNDLKWVPFIDYQIKRNGSQAVLLVAILTTATLLSMVAAFAWLFSKPLYAMPMLLMAGVGTFMVIFWDHIG